MKILKIISIIGLVYIAIVATFESVLGYFQPAGGTTITITTTDGDGDTNDRVLSLLESDDQLYVAVNHWPRAWYYRVLDYPEIQVTRDGETADYVVVPLDDAEEARVDSEHSLGLVIKLLTGFPPRYIVRLDPA